MKGVENMAKLEYFENGDIATYNGYLFRRDKKTGYYLSSRKIGTRRKRLHVYIYECEKGEIPKGFDVHHKDTDKSNNDISNLELLVKREHAKEHGRLLSDEDRENRRKNLIENAMPKAKEWHKTKGGKEWHSKHAIEVYKNLPLIKYTCTFCGKEFETKNVYSKGSNKFCSNKCKSAFRRASGIDDVEKECAYCGCKFVGNKYSNVKYCEKHRNKKNRV